MFRPFIVDLLLYTSLPHSFGWEVDPETVHREVDLINSMNLPWKAEVNYMSYFSDDEIKRRLGLRKHRKRKELVPLQTAFFDKTRKAVIPENFDIRQAWPTCTVINSVKDQGSCGSCWALSVASCFADRVCVASRGFLNKNLSTEELVTCCKPCANGGDGCQGGYLDPALEYINQNGIVSGGDYGSVEGCKPYSVAPCAINNCAPFTRAHQCRSQCTNSGYLAKYERDKYFAGPREKLGNDEKKVQLSILRKGSVIASFTMYTDLVNYKSGVYKHVTGREIGGHAVRVLGWGVENGEKYWFAVNSWNTSWGLDGRFKISRQHNNCDFGEMVTVTLPPSQNTSNIFKHSSVPSPKTATREEQGYKDGILEDAVGNGKTIPLLKTVPCNEPKTIRSLLWNLTIFTLIMCISY